MIRSVTFLALTAAVLTLPARAGAAATAIAGIPNFHQVDERIYRGGQPAARSWAGLASLGVKTVIDLRRPVEHSTAAESLAVRAAGMRYVNFPMDGFATPTAAQLAVPLALIDGAGPVFIHCKLGCDRTGTLVAAYRISRQGWENRRALAEARSMGLHWYENGMKRFIAAYRAPAPAAPPVPALADAAVTPGAAVAAGDSTRGR